MDEWWHSDRHRTSTMRAEIPENDGARDELLSWVERG